ncbi:hypothetical protein NM688_g6782 [Phlebia brevispora]|uniref:Uncharacterized protein n=1 Tax=Phlebia brevispora TaxID=194682 RepID=A0ACC1SCS9_9APHY|nr:hypothetical protein NM688_g6782 [Phlebia brevispora]
MASMSSLSELENAIGSVDMIQYATLIQHGIDGSRDDPRSPKDRLFMQQCIEKIRGCHAQLIRTTKELATLGEQWNAHLAVVCLPFEILDQIFFEATGPEDDSPYRPRLTHVCRRWRLIAINIPRLWTCPRLEPRLLRTPDYLNTVLERSRDSPLYIDCTLAPDKPNPRSPAFHTLYPQIMAQYPRIRKLAIYGSHACKYLFDCDRLAPWGALAELKIKNGIPAGNDDLHAQNWPRLKSVTLEEVAFPLWRSLKLVTPGLRSLHVRGRAGAITSAEWSSILRELPGLESLTVDHYKLYQQRTVVPLAPLPKPPASTIIRLLHLRQLKMTLWNLEEMLLLRRLEYPQEAQVELLWQHRGGLEREEAMLLKRALEIIRPRVPDCIPTRCSISTRLTHSDIALYNAANHPFLQLQCDAKEYNGKLVKLCQEIAMAFGHLTTDVLQYNLGQRFMADFPGFFSLPMEVNTLELSRVDVLDAMALYGGGGGNDSQDIPFPHVQHLVVGISDSGPPPNEATRHRMVEGIVELLQARKERSHPIPELSLRQWAREPSLIEELRKAMPDLVVHVG